MTILMHLHVCVIVSESFIRQLSSYEIVTPVRLNDFGEAFPHRLHYRRRKRSVDTDLSGSRAHYRIEAFGQAFHLNLTADAAFIAPSYSVLHLGEEEKRKNSDLRHCFFRGHVNAHKEHHAILSVCSGLFFPALGLERMCQEELSDDMGTFSSHSSQFFLEPLMSADGEELEEEHNKPHLLYRHEAQTIARSQPCNATGTPVHKHATRHSNLLHFTALFSTSQSVILRDETESSSEGFLSSDNTHSQMRGSDSQSFEEHEESVEIRKYSVRIDVEDPEHNHIHLHSNKTMQQELTSIQEGIHSSTVHSRKKRFLSYPRFVELMVTADVKMLRHHGSNLEHYVLTIMSVVASIYRDPSVGNLINIMIVKLIVIHNEQEGPNISLFAAATLQNFCVWQQSQNVQDDSDPTHHDTALLITREDICRAKDKCDTLGLAELGTMCDSYRSCSISEENGLSAAFTITHELGHVFNMPHDDSPKCRESGAKPQFHVMAPTLNYNTSPWSWSQCSQKHITDFLDTGYGECLLDEPSARVFPLPKQLPGRLYNANRQCELVFGSGSRVCPFMKQCRRLWCTRAEGDHRGCRTQHMPLADASATSNTEEEVTPALRESDRAARATGAPRTERSPDKTMKNRVFVSGTSVCLCVQHCRHGMCVSRTQDLKPVDGEWGSWGPYSTCSRSCGGGTRSTSRECNRPAMKFRSCNTDPCPRGRRDFREEQCALFNGKHFNINGITPSVQWLPKYSGIQVKDRCKLFCRVSGSMLFYQLKDRVTDGTPCGPDTYDICVQGLCRQAGCDHVLNSKSRNDECGVCGGDGSSCTTLSGSFSSAQYGYNMVVRIPAGATNIDIKQSSHSGSPEDDNYLALSDGELNFLLNGDFVVSMFRREISFRGVSIEYSGSNSSVLSVGNLYNPGVSYSFSVPIAPERQQFVWDTAGPWQECSRVCQGERRRKAVCVRKNDRLVVSDQKCDIPSRPRGTTEPCNSHCELRSECSSKCGPGFRTLDVMCVRYNLNERMSEQVENPACTDLTKPPAREGCHGHCLFKSWQYSAWSQCSQSCGGGVRTRQSFCVNNLGRRLVDGECEAQQRVLREACGEHPCPDWNTSAWSQERLSDQSCDLNTKPTPVENCEQPECVNWESGAWSPCTVSCGPGYQMRAVRCVSTVYSQTRDDRECDAASRPTDRQDCESPVCPRAAPVIFTRGLSEEAPQQLTEWRFGSWTTCSASCGEGRRERYVSCRDVQGLVADDSSCSHLPRPPNSA
ncbi:hypothetical protein DNTS_028393, partial [Danionella cerebrum]